MFTSILSYSYGKRSKVSDVIKMLKESGSAQDFFHSESLPATFALNKHILSHCSDDIMLYTQRDMCAVCEVTWRKITESFPIKGKVYVLSSEPYMADESWKRHASEDCKLVKIPAISVDKGDVRSQFIRNLLVQQRTEKTVTATISELYTFVKDLFLTCEEHLSKTLSKSEFDPGEVNSVVISMLEQSDLAKMGVDADVKKVILGFAKEQCLVG